jgi:hypothetical protein
VLVRHAQRARQGSRSATSDLGGVARIEPDARPPGLEAAHGLLQRFLERAADRHRLADRLHLGRQRRVGALELLEGEARDLDHRVVDRRLEARRRLAS